MTAFQFGLVAGSIKSLFGKNKEEKQEDIDMDSVDIDLLEKVLAKAKIVQKPELYDYTDISKHYQKIKKDEEMKNGGKLPSDKSKIWKIMVKLTRNSDVTREELKTIMEMLFIKS